jgi:hypothetical protein
VSVVFNTTASELKRIANEDGMYPNFDGLTFSEFNGVTTVSGTQLCVFMFMHEVYAMCDGDFGVLLDV